MNLFFVIRLVVAQKSKKTPTDCSYTSTLGCFMAELSFWKNHRTDRNAIKAFICPTFVPTSLVFNIFMPFINLLDTPITLSSHEQKNNNIYTLLPGSQQPTFTLTSLHLRLPPNPLRKRMGLLPPASHPRHLSSVWCFSVHIESLFCFFLKRRQSIKWP